MSRENRHYENLLGGEIMLHRALLFARVFDWIEVQNYKTMMTQTWVFSTQCFISNDTTLDLLPELEVKEPEYGSSVYSPQLWTGNIDKSQISKISQELRMLSSVTINCQVTKIVMNSGSQLSVL